MAKSEKKIIKSGSREKAKVGKNVSVTRMEKFVKAI